MPVVTLTRPAPGDPPSAGARDPGGLPPAPATLEATGLSPLGVCELVLKAMHQLGLGQLQELTRQLKLPVGLLELVFGTLRKEMLVEVRRRGQVAGDVWYELTQAGRQRAGEALSRSLYCGAAPVTLADYVRQVQAHAVSRMAVTRETVRRRLGEVVMPPDVADKLGAALNSGRPMLVYGPPGAGKTFLCEQAARLMSGPVPVPHALDVDGEIVRVFDPLVHRPVAPAFETGMALDNRFRADDRWVLCERPVVVAAGELTLDMLDLAYDPRAGYYQAPPHVKANNGLLLVDDLGRQRVAPAQLFNRWLLPMERGVDYLTLRNGSKFRVPFDLLLLFSTNLQPSELADEAFLRRIAYKVPLGELPQPLYRRVFDQACAERGLPAEDSGFEALLELHRASRRPLLACTPRDLVSQAIDRAAYLEEPPSLTPAALRWAWRNHHASDVPLAPAGPGELG